MEKIRQTVLNSFDAVLFDMDGVIIDGMPWHARAWMEIFKKHGLPLTELDVYLREGEPAKSALRYFLRDHPALISDDLLQRIILEKEAYFKTNACVRPFAGAFAFIENLRLDRKKTALVTGTARHELESVLPAYFFPLFDVVVTGDEVSKGKPYPEPYLKAQNELGYPKERLLVIENAPLGIASARAAGLKVWAVATSLEAQFLKDADEIFSDMLSLCQTVYPEKKHGF
jgi:beta-phosphoglucomutase-like phosphatase (HAD superfamily)